FESVSKFSTNDLRSKHKFWGRGINQWGTAQYLEHKGSDFPIYRLVEGETYTLKLYGRSRKACVDFIILFSTSLNLSVNNQDFAKQNPELYRPGGPGTLSEKVAKILFPKTATYLSKVGETKQMDYNVFPSTAVDQSVTWSSSNERVAIVSQSGFITGISEGSATITATTNDGKLTAVNKMEVGRYIETFDNFKKYALNGNKYKGDNGFEWSINGNHTTRMNNTTSVQFNRQVTGIRGVNIPNGIGSFSVQIRHLFLLQNPRKTVLLINGIPVDSIENTTNLVYDFVVKDINVEGDFTLALKNGTEAASKAHTVMYDNLTWSPYTARPSVERRREETQIILSLVDEANQLMSYPNPVSDRIFIKGLSEGVYSVKVYALSGAELLTTDVVRTMNDGDEASIELSDLSKGTYLLDITGGDTHFKTQVVIR
ncbi:MAG: Ig-like domain-containing protein, partial [Bacteroidota bacterium]